MRREAPRGPFVASMIGSFALVALGACSARSAPTPALLRVAASQTQESEAVRTASPAATANAAAEPGAAPCQAPAEALPALTEGPYFKAGSPERASLVEPQTVGERLVLSGFALDADCTPLPGTRLDFWQADGNGSYDNAGFGLRGHQYTDATGGYRLSTVVPGLYPGRTEHIHVKVQPPGGNTLTTQLFFPDVSGNQIDRIFDARLVIKMSPGPEGWIGTFDFILEAP